MKLTFYGATSTVTGSKYLIEDSGKRILVDCGLFQGYRELRQRNWEPFPVDPKSIDAVILTHAHLDHSGYLPLLVKNGFRGPVYASNATRDLCEIILLDSGRIQEEDARQANKYGYSRHVPALPLYTEEDAYIALGHIKKVNFNTSYELGPKLSFDLSRSGHILGSSFVTVRNERSSLVFSGDVGRPNDPIMKHPVTIQHADYLVLESTYGDRLHPRNDTIEQFEEVINSTAAKGGSVIIPAFAVGRAQMVLYYLYQLRQQKRISLQIPIYLDSPMAQNATDLWSNYTSEHNIAKGVCSAICSIANYVQSSDESKRLKELNGPSVIISASGMAEGGRVVQHIIDFGSKSRNTILFTGFQAAGTLGEHILNGEKEVKIHGQMVPIRARVELVETLSSHADYSELLLWLKGFESPPKETFITHGEPKAAEALKAKIEETLGWKATIPQYKASFDLQCHSQEGASSL